MLGSTTLCRSYYSICLLNIYPLMMMMAMLMLGEEKKVRRTNATFSFQLSSVVVYLDVDGNWKISCSAFTSTLLAVLYLFVQIVVSLRF